MSQNAGQTMNETEPGIIADQLSRVCDPQYCTPARFNQIILQSIVVLFRETTQVWVFDFLKGDDSLVLWGWLIQRGPLNGVASASEMTLHITHPSRQPSCILPSQNHNIPCY